MLKAGMFIGDRYEIIEKVGTGGMADVYKARCHRLNRFVAIKVLKSEYSDDRNFVTKFRVEAQSAAGLSHPNIVNVYDVGEDNGTYYIVMELVEGITLKSYIERKGKLDTKESIGISIQIASGIEAAHYNHIIHRDIKPQNIIISKDGKVKVTDFGIAKATSSNTISSNAMGSVHYISPEQARGGYSDEKSDIYSLGITMYEMLTGKVPFEGDNTVAVALLHIQGELISPRDLEPQIPLCLEKIILKCTQKKSERRYPKISELIADLRRSLANPDADFVKMETSSVDNSPTIALTADDINNIKNGARKVTDNYRREEQEAKAEVKKPIESSNLTSDDYVKDEGETDIDPKLEKLLVVGGVLVAIILAFAIIYLIGQALGVFKFPGSNKDKPTTEATVPTEDVTESGIIVPRVVGKLFEDGEKELNDLELGIDISAREYSDIYEKDIIIEQEHEGESVEVNTTIKVKVSNGPEMLTLIDVYTYTETEARSMLREEYGEGLKVIPEREFDDVIEEGKVIRTMPERGSSIKRTDEIILYVSSGKENKEVSVPGLINLTEAEAVEKLRENGLELGKVTKDNFENIKEGLVAYQSYTIGTLVEPGTAIDITISLGPKPVEEKYIYIGEVPILDSPFDEFNQEGYISFTITLNGKTTEIKGEDMTEDDFPFTLQLNEGDVDSEGVGLIRMYLNEELCPNVSWEMKVTKKVVN